MFESFKAAHTAVKIGFFVSSLTVASLGARLAAADGSPNAAGTEFGVSVAHKIHGDLSDASLKKLVDAEAGAVFARHDPYGLAKPKADLLELFESGPPAKLDVSPLTADALNDAVPIADGPNLPAKRFVFKGSAEDRTAAVTCLTQAVYYEAGFEPVDGARAVAQVVLNRVRHPIFPKTVCGVVFQGADLRTGCQFSFACDGSLAKTPATAALARARQIAEAALGGYVEKSVGEATHYHTQWILPWWAPTVAKVAKVGTQIFYRWPGALGLPDAFTGRYAGNEPTRTPTTATAAANATALAAETTTFGEERVHAIVTAEPTQIAAAVPEITKAPAAVMETAALRLDAPDLKLKTAPIAAAAGQAYFSCSAGPCRHW
jgi:spore germination cell wall hydrolase CwlJ-like protein